MVLALGNSINSSPGTNRSSQDHPCGQVICWSTGLMSVRGGAGAFVGEAPCPMMLLTDNARIIIESRALTLSWDAACAEYIGQDRPTNVVTHKVPGAPPQNLRCILRGIANCCNCQASHDNVWCDQCPEIWVWESPYATQIEGHTSTASYAIAFRVQQQLVPRLPSWSASPRGAPGVPLGVPE